MSNNTNTTGEANPNKQHAYENNGFDITIPDCVSVAPALTPNCKNIYLALKWHQRDHENCFPGYKKLMERTGIKSKATIALHMKVLIAIGLVTKIRRGKRQTNIYWVVKINWGIRNKLKVSNAHYLAQIKEQARVAREERKEKKRQIFYALLDQYVTDEKTYPQNDEVHSLVFQSKVSSQREDISSSKISIGGENSKIENLERSENTEPRTDGMEQVAKLLGRYTVLIQKQPLNTPGEVTANQNCLNDPQYPEKFTPQEDPLQPCSGEINERLNWLGKKVSFDVGDTTHTRENTKQVKNIWREQLAQGVGHGIHSFIEVALTAIGLTREIDAERPGAYFFRTFRQRVELLESG